MPVDELLAKAERFIKSAQLLASDEDYDGAASRLYYAMFFIAEALLEVEGLAFSSHRAVQAAYGAQFAKTGRLDPRFHRALLYAFQQRQLGDYSVESHVARSVVAEMTEDATAFLAAARAWLTKSGQA